MSPENTSEVTSAAKMQQQVAEGVISRLRREILTPFSCDTFPPRHGSRLDVT